MLNTIGKNKTNANSPSFNGGNDLLLTNAVIPLDPPICQLSIYKKDFDNDQAITNDLPHRSVLVDMFLAKHAD